MSHLSLKQLLLWGVLAAAQATLWADDGVVLIDQNRAVAGNVTPGDEPGFPVTISQAGSYRLTGNLVVPDSDTTAVRITAESVTLDLGGFSIAGPGGCTGPAVTCLGPGQGIGVQAGGDEKSGPRGVRVRNGSVHGMGRMGIWLTGDGSLVERVSVYANAAGGMSVAGSVIRSSATENGAFGIIGGIVRDCTVLKNAADGIILDSGGVATGNVSSFNGGLGIAAPFGTAAGNTMFLNKAFGISALCPASIAGNTIVAGDGGGSIESRGTGCVLVNNATR